MTKKHESNKLGIWTSTSLVVGNMIGSGVFLIPAAMAAYGGIGLLGWIFSAVGSFFLARVFSNLSKLLPNKTGGPYVYTREGLGDFAGFMVAWGYWLANCGACAAIAISFISAMSSFFPVLATSSTAAIITGLASIWIIVLINSRGVVLSGRFQLLTTILKLVPLILISVSGLFFIRAQNFHPFNPSGKLIFSVITITATMTMFAFVGIESATVPAGSTENSGKIVSRATILGMLISTLVYILGSFSIMGMIPAAQLQQSATPYADAAAIIFGPTARYLASAGVAIAAFGALNGWTLVQGQVPYAVAKDKLFPGIFGRLNKKGVPAFGMAISACATTLLLLMNYTKGLVEQFKFLLLLATLSVLIPYLFSAAAYIILGTKKNALHKASLTSVIVLGLLAFVYSLWEIYGSGEQTVFYGFLFLMAGIPFYIWLSYKRHREEE
ncbi:MAG TPA: amino acid permease [Mucilaginibacter sp.]